MISEAVKSSALLLVVALAAACGGGGESSGGDTTFSIVPDSITITSEGESCPSGFAGRVFVYGGAGPYRLDNTVPDEIVLSSGSVSGPGGYFDVFLNGNVCLDPGSVVVVDQSGKTVTLTLTSKAASGAGG